MTPLSANRCYTDGIIALACARCDAGSHCNVCDSDLRGNLMGDER